jgi:transcriptional regulator with XRE-family HTH domain
MLRKNKHLTQEALAELIGMDTQHLCKMENGNHFPTLKNLLKLADAFGLNVHCLFLAVANENNLLSKINAEMGQLEQKDLKLILEIVKLIKKIK